jgi:DNA repair protein RecN (Recombination protein N)
LNRFSLAYHRVLALINMLLELRIRNFAIIDELNMTFGRGFNVITGETGAGKSIILSAVQMLLGDKSSEELIRSSEQEASVEALFDIEKNRAVREKMESKYQDFAGDEASLVLRRLISRAGRGRALLNGNLATLGMLSDIGGQLLSIYGQHEHQALQRIETHIDLMDEFGGLLEARAVFQERYEEFRALSEEVRRLGEEEEKNQKDRELMAFQSREIEESGIQKGEEEGLRQERSVLSHAKKLAGFAQLSQETLEGEDRSAIASLQTVLNQGRGAAEIDPSLEPVLKGIESCLIQLQETALAVRDYSRRVEFNPTRVEEIENRLADIDRLKRKYGHSIEEVLAFKESLDQKLASFVSDRERLSGLQASAEPLRIEVDELAGRLSAARKKAGLQLKEAIEKEMASLGMRRTTFDVSISPASLSSRGGDRVEFLISPNVGEDPKPLARIASGGELSRIMLAIKRILAGVGGMQVLVFDEVDSGIGGATAEVVGRKLRDLSRRHQVICVTHLAQIACFADTHHTVRKELKNGRTVTHVEKLEKGRVLDEISRMIGGTTVTEKTRAHAREMLERGKGEGRREKT